MANVNWQESSMYDIADLLEAGTIKDNNLKHQISYYRCVSNTAMIGKLECARKIVKLRKLAAEIEAYKATMCTRFNSHSSM